LIHEKDSAALIGFKKLRDESFSDNLMKEKGMNDVLLTGGGIIPDEDIEALSKLGVGKLFHPGTNTHEIADYIIDWVKENRNF